MHAGEKDLKRVLFVIPTLGGGGAERVFLHILRHLDRKKFSPKVVLFEKKGELLSDLPSDIEVIALKDTEGVYKTYGTVFLKLTRRISKVFRTEKPDIVLSFMWYTNFVTLLGRMLSRVRCRVVISERYSLSPSFEGKLVEFLRRMTIRLFYPRADNIIVNSKEMGRQIVKLSRVSVNKVTVIYNPVDTVRVLHLGKEKVDHPWFHDGLPIIIGIGRLSRQKGFDYLIHAIRLLAVQGKDCRLVLLGTGTEENNLKKLASDLGIAERVEILGFQQNPYLFLARSTVFVLSSLYEGFPNVLLEALALGTPSIATRCPTGPEELVTDGVNGILIPPADKHALASALEKLLSDNTLRAQLSDAGKKRSMDFSVEHIVKQYEDALEGICAASVEK